MTLKIDEKKILMNGIGAKFTLADRFTFDSVSNSLIDKGFDNEFIRLGSNESRILLLLSQRPNEVVTRDELYDFVWREQGFEVDDSSLTQAISTLRKQLKDSTKSPQFIKTVPKRGYQFIAKVSELSATDKQIHPDETDLVLVQSTHESTETEFDHEITPVVAVSKPNIDERQSVSTQNNHAKYSLDLVSKVLLLITVLLPVFAILFTHPTASEFRTLETYDDVVVNTPMNHPDISSWIPSIELCINTYMNKYPDKPALEKVIATGGQNDVLVLNYIHKPEYSSSNITLKIVANQNEISKICQGGASQ